MVQQAQILKQSFSEYIEKPHPKVIILRHDVDLFPKYG